MQKHRCQKHHQPQAVPKCIMNINSINIKKVYINTMKQKNYNGSVLGNLKNPLTVMDVCWQLSVVNVYFCEGVNNDNNQSVFNIAMQHRTPLSPICFPVWCVRQSNIPFFLGLGSNDREDKLASDTPCLARKGLTSSPELLFGREYVPRITISELLPQSSVPQRRRKN